MLTMLLAVALTQAPNVTAADAPNCTAVAKLPRAIAPVWIWPSYAYGQVAGWPAQYATARADNWGITSYAPGSVPVEMQRMLRAAEANGGILARPALSRRDRYLRDLGRAIDDARAK